MKKIISILLVAVLVLGMFPATALTANAAGGTFTKVTSVDEITAGGKFLVVAEAKGTYRAMSTTIAKKIASSIVTVSNDAITVTADTLVWTIAATPNGISLSNGSSYVGYKSSTDLQSTSSAYSWTVTESTTDGEFQLSAAAAGRGLVFRASTYNQFGGYSTSNLNNSTSTSEYRYLQFYKESTSTTPDPEEPACEHDNTVNQNVVAPGCETVGTHDVYCNDCQTTIKTDVETAALGHNYVNGVCSRCNAEEPEAPAAPAGYVLTDITNIQPTDKVVITMTTANGTVYALPNNGGASTPTATIITVTGNTLTNTPDDTLLWNIGGSTGAYILYPNGKTDTWLYHTSSNSGVRIGTTTATYSIDSTNYLKDSNHGRYLGVYTSKPDWRCYTNTTGNTANQTLRFYVQSAGSSEECTHANTTPIPAVDATCTSTGLTEGLKCADCPHIITEQTVTSALGHNMVEGICSRCGLYEHKAEVMTAAPGNGDKIIIHHISSNSALGSTAKSDDLVAIATAPTEGKLPYYTSVAILTVGQIGETYTFTNNGKYLSTTGSNQLGFVANADANSYWTIELTNEKFIITNAGTSTLALEYYNGAFTTYTAGTGDYFQMALYLVEKGEEACQHPTTEPIPAVDATCTSTGLTEGVKCTVCGVTTVPQTDVPMLNHNYENDACTECGAKKPARYYIAAYRDSEEQYYYMTSDLESDKRYQAVATNVLPSNIDPDVALSNHVFILTDNGDGTCYLQAENVTGDNYLNHTGSSNTGTYTSAENAPKLTINDSTEVEGAKNIHFTSDAERYLSLNAAKDSNYFAWYKGTQKQDLILIPVEKAATTTVTLYGDVDGIAVGNNQILDLKGNAATNVTGTNIRVYDSTATATAEGTGTLTVAAGTDVVVDNTVGGKRYIALEGENNTYTFHVLEMKLSAVTLRTSNAGFYYNAKIVCDPTLAGAVDTYGVALSLDSMPDASVATKTTVANEGETSLTSGVAFTSGAVSGIFKAGADNAARGALSIYANAYIKIGDTVILADTTIGDTVEDDGFNGIALSMRNVMESLDAKVYPGLAAETATEEQKAQKAVVDQFYLDWAAAMTGWLLPNISAAVA